MDVKKYPLSYHLKEFKLRLIYILVFYVVSVGILYIYSDDLYQFLLNPLESVINKQGKSMIFTNLVEVFFSYLKLSTSAAFMLVIPIIAYNIYTFLAPGLYPDERKMLAMITLTSPLLYWFGVLFCYYIVIPKAWEFFLSFENHSAKIPIVLEAKVSEYLQLVVDLAVAFGIAFQLPVILLILTLIGVISPRTLENKRRFAIVIIFILGGILTPPDIFSQFALAIPMLLLYEISIKICKIVEHKRKLNVRP
ncbi:MAG: Sec-independent protein translocase protein TatC [Rickettsiaceae bacterium]|jgi:sec-independent protein translocase protein TatC|nr:Sec-independent protein translocase protein TatC [Rickettsiaceae bacterium]